MIIKKMMPSLPLLASLVLPLAVFAQTAASAVESVNPKTPIAAELEPAVHFVPEPVTLAPTSAQDAKAVLKLALEKQGQFQAKFSQTVKDVNGKLIQQSNGTFAITRPGKFHWQIIQPEEELIISNGTILWYYSPFLEQVSIMNVQNALRDTPFLLMAQQDSQSWQQYDVSMIQQADGLRFALQNKEQQDSTFFIQLDMQQNLQSFSVKEKGGSLSEFMVSDLKSQDFPPEKFSFKIPAGTEIDDQR